MYQLRITLLHIGIVHAVVPQYPAFLLIPCLLACRPPTCSVKVYTFWLRPQGFSVKGGEYDISCRLLSRSHGAIWPVAGKQPVHQRIYNHHENKSYEEAIPTLDTCRHVPWIETKDTDV